jgi:hypothetical protein
MTGPLVYIEYISRRPGVSLEAFHALAGHGQTGWSAENPEEVLLANLGRTWRTGPEPEYLAFWYTPHQGLDRFDDWERIFRSGEADEFEEPFKIAARIDKAGSYDPLTEPIPVETERVYLEFFDIAQGSTRDDVRGAYEERSAAHPELTLNFLLDRIGRLGPEPRGIAAWSLPSWAHLEEIARDLDGAAAPVRLVTAGMYSQFGKETL